MGASRKRQASGWKGLVGTAAIIGVIAVIVFGLFHIRKVQVKGNSRYTAQQIQKDLIYDVKTGNTLFLAWKYRNAVKESRTPYLQSVQVKIVSPGTVSVNVTETAVIGCVVYNGQYVSFDEDGIILSIGDQADESVPMVTGFAMDEPVLYGRLPAQNTTQRSTLLQTASLLRSSGLEVKEISFDDNQNITLQIGTVAVALGQAEYLEEKIANLISIYPQISDLTGTLRMEAFTGRTGADGQAHAITFEESAAAVEQTTEGEQETNGPTSTETFQAFDSNGNLHNDARVVDGKVVDGNGNELAGCTLNEDGNVVDAYMNVIELNLPMAPAKDESAEAEGSDDGQNEAAGDGGTTVSDDDSQNTGTGDDEANAENVEEAPAAGDTSNYVQVFDSNGTLYNDAHIQGGQVVDSNGSPIAGCRVDENGNIVDAYMNNIDPNTGALLNGN